MIFEKRKELLMLSSVIVIGSILLWPAAKQDPQPLDAPNQQALSVIAPPMKEKTQAVKVQNVVKQELPRPLESVTVAQGMQHEMQRVADIYEQRSRYAPYSLYLSAEQTDLINPNQSHESPRAYEVDGESISILISPSKYRFSTAETVTVEIIIRSSVAGLKSLTKLEAELMSTSSKQRWPLKILHTSDQQGSRSIQASMDLSSELTSFNDKEYAVIVNASFNGDSPVIQSAPIQIITQVAKVIGLGMNRIEGNNLIIPINIDVEQAGYYQISGSLFAVATNSAVSYLIAKERLSRGSNIVNAKVQGLVLRDKGFSGPFRLQGITLVKKSERPGMPEEYGIADESYPVSSIDLNDFESIPYEDPMTEQRLEFMRSIGQ